MSRAKNLNCRCRRLPEAAMTIPLVNVTGKYGAYKYLFDNICEAAGNHLFSMVAPDGTDPAYGEVWEIESDDTIIPITASPSRTFTVTTTVNSLAKGGVVVEARWTDVDGLFFRYESMNPWQPHAGMAMKLVDYDTTVTAVTFRDYVCLRPAVRLGDGSCACRSGSPPPFIVVVEIPTATDSDDPVLDCLCRASSGTFVFGLHDSGPIGGCVEGLDFSYDCGTPGTGQISYYLREYVPPGESEVDFNKALLQIEYGGGPLPSYELLVERGTCDIARNGGTFSLPGGACDSTENATMTFIPMTEDGELRTSAPCGELYCGGTSQWYLRRRCYDGSSAEYYWEPIPGDSCKGKCDTDDCRPTEPFALMEGLVTDEDATDAGYIAALDTVIAGGCGCEAIPAEPQCEDGCSVWTLRRDICEGSIPDHLYYWEYNDGCSEDCNIGFCEPVPPVEPVLNVMPVAEDPELEALVGTQFRGTCECGATPYERPECAVCEDCDDVIDNKTFTISGLAAPDDVFNGTYTLIKGDADCAFAPVTCCWYGCEEDFLSCAILTFDGGVWSLTIQNGADYEAVGTACDESILMDKTNDLTTGDVFPATLTISVP